MPKTETEWQELSDLLAREIMGWRKGTEVLSNKPSGSCLPMYWWHDNEGDRWWPTAYSHVTGGLDSWRPYDNITQAMLVLKTLLAKAGKYAVARISIRPPPSHCLVTIHNWVATAGTPAMLVRSPYVDNETQAICLAAKEWLKAQKERQNVSQQEST